MVQWERLYAKRVLGMQASDIREMFKLAEHSDIISFAGGFPGVDSFPVPEVAQALQRLLQNESSVALQYGPTEGFRELREWIAREMTAEGVPTDPDGVLITTGSQQALDLISKAFLDPGDVVVVEKPGYVGGLGAARNYEARFLGISLDEEGLDTTELAAALAARSQSPDARVKFAYVVPNFQNPAGVTLSEQRRRHLLELATAHDFLVIEDNPYGLLRYEGKACPHIKALDREGRVLYLGSFSKVFVPGIRVGWVVADPAVVRSLTIAKQATDLCGSSLGQRLALACVREGFLEGHLTRLIELYRRKRDVALAAMQRYFPPGVRWNRPQGGFFIWIELPEGLDARELLPRAITEERVAYVCGSAFYTDGGGRRTIRLAFSQPTVEEIEEGIRRLGRLFTRACEELAPASLAADQG